MNSKAVSRGHPAHVGLDAIPFKELSEVSRQTATPEISAHNLRLLDALVQAIRGLRILCGDLFVSSFSSFAGWAELLLIFLKCLRIVVGN